MTGRITEEAELVAADLPHAPNGCPLPLHLILGGTSEPFS